MDTTALATAAPRATEDAAPSVNIQVITVDMPVDVRTLPAFEKPLHVGVREAALLTKAGLSLGETAPRRDLAGIPRAVMGWKLPE